jgi:endonuclease YncB( thermonuclease family)
MSKLTSPTPATYAALRRGVENVVLEGRRQIERAWVQTYHECGRMIHEHLLLKKEKAVYGAYLYRQLATDTGVDIRTLQQSVQFYRYFPIARHGAQLSWAHYRALVQVDDAEKREQLLRTALREGWTSPQLVERVRLLNALSEEATGGPERSPAAIKLLPAKRGTPGVHRVVARGEALAVDLGFKLYVGLEDDAAFKTGGFATFDSRGRAVAAPDATKADLFTYAVTVRRVIDGDTLEVEIPLPRGYAHQLKLRLRAIDCPEMDTPAGKAAKRFTASLLAPATAVEIVTSKPDKYDRYLADVFIPDGAGEFTFLNNELLRSGHAVRKDDWSAADWER